MYKTNFLTNILILPKLVTNDLLIFVRNANARIESPIAYISDVVASTFNREPAGYENRPAIIGGACAKRNDLR